MVLGRCFVFGYLDPERYLIIVQSRGPQHGPLKFILVLEYPLYTKHSKGPCSEKLESCKCSGNHGINRTSMLLIYSRQEPCSFSHYSGALLAWVLLTCPLEDNKFMKTLDAPTTEEDLRCGPWC